MLPFIWLFVAVLVVVFVVCREAAEKCLPEKPLQPPPPLSCQPTTRHPTGPDPRANCVASGRHVDRISLCPLITVRQFLNAPLAGILWTLNCLALTLSFSVSPSPSLAPGMANLHVSIVRAETTLKMRLDFYRFNQAVTLCAPPIIHPPHCLSVSFVFHFVYIFCATTCDDFHT